MWTYQGKEIFDEEIEGYSGFVYIITNTKNNKKYIGKKLFNFTRTKKTKGKRNKKVKKASDWRTYFGSNKELLEDVKLQGEQDFKREILKLCKNKGTTNYWEMKYQIKHEVLESDKYYNDWIMVKVHRSHIKG